MLSIPVKLGLEAGKAEQALRDFFNGVEDALDGILDLNGSKVDFEVNMRATGDDVVKELKDTEAATKKLTDSVKKHDKGQEQSISRTKFRIQQLKKERDELTANTQKHKEAAQAVKRLEAEFRTLQGVQSGSINDLKSQRNELISLKDSVRINTPEFKKLTKEIKKFDKQLDASRPKANSFVGAFAKIAVVSAGIQAVGSALRSVGNTIDTYVRRTKEVEGFNLALRNVGLEQAEVSRIFQQAETTANALGAPLAQVEKTYKRMVPALLAVGTSSADSDKFIEQISARTQTLGLNTEQSGRLLEAFAQVLSKGKLQAEELNQQISELDGAFRTQFADALGVSTEALNDLISSSQITADVFVKTVNKMSNGAEILKKRILAGTATIQQFENEISNIDTKNIEDIGKAIEPAIKSFLKIRLAVAAFIKEFKKSAQFDTLVTIFNSAAKGAELFVAGLIKVLQVIGQLTGPISRVIDFILQIGKGFGGSVGILIASAASIATITAAIKGLIALKAGLAFVALQFKNLGVAITGSKAAAVTTIPAVTKMGTVITGSGVIVEKAAETTAKYGDAVAEAGTQAVTTSSKLAALGKAAIKVAALMAVVAIVDKIISSFTAAGKAAEEMNQRFAGIEFDLLDKIEELNKTAKETPESLEALGASLEVASANAERSGRVSQGLGIALAALGGVALVAATIVGGPFGTALVAGGIKAGVAAVGIKGLATATALGGAAALSAKASMDELAKATKKLEASGSGKAYLERQEEIAAAIDKSEDELLKLGVTAGQVDFSSFKDAGGDIVEVSRQAQAQVDVLKSNIAANKELIKSERKKTGLKEEELAVSKANIEVAKQNIKEDQKELAIKERRSRASSRFVVQLLKEGDAAALAAASTEEMKKATKSFLDELDTDVIKQQTEAIEKYGKKINAASLLAAANIEIDQAASELRLEGFEKEIAKLNELEKLKGPLSDKDKKRQEELTKLVAKETQKQAQLGIAARNAVIDAFKAGIAEVDGQVDIILQSSSRLKGAFDGISGTFVSGLQAANGLINEITSRELEGLEVGSKKRRQIIQRQLKAQALTNEIENRIAVLKLTTQNKIATSQARIEQIRLANAAKIAQAEGKSGLAAALSDAANQQGLIIKGLGQQFRIEKELLGIQKATKDQKLINKGIDEKIEESAQGVAKRLDVQLVNQQQSIQKTEKLVGLTGDYGTAIGKAATKSQDTAEALQETSLDKGVEEAEEITNALGNAKGAGDGLQSVMEAVKDTISGGADEANKIVGFLRTSVSEAGKLQEIVLRSGSRRAMGGPVTSGKQYTVNDGGGREGFLSNSGKFSMLPAARNMQWTAPTSGTVIPANLVNDFISASSSEKIQSASSGIKPKQSLASNTTSEGVSGNLVKQMTAALTGSGGNQRITNNVTIQSQQPVTDASKIMTNVARMRLRNGRRI